MVKTRSVIQLEKQRSESEPQLVQNAINLQQPTPKPGPSSVQLGSTCMRDDATGSIVKSEQLHFKTPRSHRTDNSVRTKKSSSVSSREAQRRKLQLEAEKAKARIEINIINKQLEADLAELDEYSPRSEASSKAGDIKSWVERSRQELELQQATMMEQNDGELQPSASRAAAAVCTDTYWPTQQLQPPAAAARDYTYRPTQQIMPSAPAAAAARADTNRPTYQQHPSAAAAAVCANTNGPIEQLTNAIRNLITTPTVQQHNTTLLSRLSTPKELPIFDGEPMDWLAFKQAYEESTELCAYSDKENIWRLRKCLRGPAREAVAALLIGGSSSAEIMAVLELQFGNPEIILTRLLASVKRMNNLPADYHREIVPFAIKIKNYVAAVRALGRQEYMHGAEVTSLLIAKLPPTLLSKWADYSYPLLTEPWPKPRLEILASFLSDEAVKTSTCAASLLQPSSNYFKRKPYDHINNIQSVLVSDRNDNKCRFCNVANHKLPECKKFKRALRKDRWQHVKRNGVCYKCLSARHRQEECPASCCDVDNCGQSHHRLLHYIPRAETSVPTPVERTETVTHINKNNSVSLKIVPIVIQGVNGSVRTSALLDDGSTVSLISASLAKEAGLRGRRDCLRVCGAWDNSELVCDTQLVNLTVSEPDSDKMFTINARVISELNLPKQNFNSIDLSKYKHLCNLQLNNDLCSYSLAPQVLIGQDNFHLLVPLETKIGKPNEPCATRTPLGWCLHGKFPLSSPSPLRHSMLFVSSDGSDQDAIELRELHDQVKRSFSFESMGVSTKPRRNSEDVRAESILEQTSTLVDGRWYVGIPWKDEKAVMANSFPTALSRLRGVEQKMRKNPEYAERYRERIRHLLLNDYARKVTDHAKVSPKMWYLPHFGVDNPNKKKLRLVYDAAAKSGEVCLNDYIIKGPDLLASLYGIMLRFREHQVAISGDIKDMFLRVKVREEDQDAFRFLFRSELDGEIEVYVMTSLIFGANCSPFIAQFIKNKNARLYKGEFPAAVTAIHEQHFMDDYLDSVPETSAAIQLAHDVTEVHLRGGFEIRNWTSNSKEVLESIPKESLGEAAVKLKLGQQGGERTLGLVWYPSDDTLKCDVSFKKIPTNLADGTKRPTKREILRVVMSIFDVYGFLAPFTIVGKILLQETWKQKAGWDDDVTDTVHRKWQDWITQLGTIDKIRLPRYYVTAACVSDASSEPVPSCPSVQYESTSSDAPAPMLTNHCYRNLQLHMFSDASLKAMCAVGYWRWTIENVVYVAFITSRCRVAPLRPVSVPRMEIQAAVMSVRLAETILEAHRIVPERKVYWCDSSTVLHWIRNSHRNYKQFVAHRLGEIDELSNPNEWRYVPSKLNIADAATRDVCDFDLLKSAWLHGPEYLKKDEQQWPRDFTFHEPENKEAQIEVINTIKNESNILPIPDATRFSSWLRLLRATSIVLKFIYKCRKQTHLFPEAMDRAEILLLKQSQLEYFRNEILELRKNKPIPRSSKILTLSPYLDELGVLRLGGRIDAAAGVLPETKNPIILDGTSQIAKLIVKHYHSYFAHGNSESIVNEVKQRYWITRLRPLVKTTISQCMFCRIKKCKPEVPRMGDLPSARLSHHQRAFTHCGLDLFSGLEVTVGRRREKRYGVLFTCMTVRAVHLEVVPTLTSDSLIMALRRMAARRGWPLHLYSDNGTNLRGADVELKKSIQELDENFLKDEAMNHGTKWSFIPPASPHWGGAWERLIRSVKTSLKVVLKERAPREEVLITLLAEVENMVNSRPLTHVSVDPADGETLTPNHFLIGTSSNLPRMGVFDGSDLYLRKQWRTAQRLADMFWRRWVKEVLPDLLPRSKWNTEKRNLQVGDLVLVVDPDGPRNLWPKGVIQEVIPGRDGRVRMVIIKTKNGTLTRSVTRVAHIPVVNECC